MKIGNLKPEVSVIQGGMGIGVSLSGLAGAVAKEGAVGIISTAQIGYRDPDFDKEPVECNLKAIKSEVKKAKEISNGGIIGVNIMTATRFYERYVKAAVEAGVDLIISGAGLPVDLPKLTEGSDVKISPIVSSLKAYNVITKLWKKKYNRLPDLLVIEGPLAGGHLGFSKDDLQNYSKNEYDNEIVNIIEAVRKTEKENDCNIPVVVGGGVFDRADMDYYLNLGADGVQIATRFVPTYECDASQAFKDMYIKAEEKDIEIITSPVGMPGRAIHNKFIEMVADGKRMLAPCRQCISKCNPAEIPYCITKALVNAVTGDVDNGLVFCGHNAYRCSGMEKVSDIIQEFR